MEPSIVSTPVQTYYIGLPAIYDVIFACCLLIYSLIVQSTIVSNAASIEAHSHSPPLNFLAVIYTIRPSILWWNTSSNVIISSVTTQISLPYRITDYTTNLYIITRALIVAPVLPVPLAPSPISSDISAGCCKALPSHYYFMWLWVIGKGMMWLPQVVLYWSWLPSDLLWSTAAISLAVFGITVPSVTLLFLSGNCSATMVALVIHIAHNVGMELGVLWVFAYFNANGVYWSGFVGQSYYETSRDTLGMDTGITAYWLRSWPHTQSEDVLSGWILVDTSLSMALSHAIVCDGTPQTRPLDPLHILGMGFVVADAPGK